MLAYSEETGQWEFLFPSRGEEPDRAELSALRDTSRTMFLTTERVRVISPWSFSYPTRLRKDD